MGFAFGELAHLHQRQHLIDTAGDFILGHFLLVRAECDILLDRHVRKQGIRLEHHIHRLFVRRNIVH